MSKEFRPASWMGDLSEADRRRPLEDITLPGSRASVAYEVLRGPLVGTKLSKKKLVEISMVRKSGRSSVERWLMTQRLDVRTQLDIGIRAFDLKVSAVRGELFVSRSYLMAPLMKVLETIAKWVRGSTEYVEVRIFRDPKGRVTRDEALESLEVVQDILDNVLLRTTMIARQGITLENAAGKMCVVWGLDAPRDATGIIRPADDLSLRITKWDLKTISARSASPEDVVKRISKYLRHLENFPDDTRLKVLPIVLDGDEGGISLRGPMRTPSSLEVARDVRPVVDEYLKMRLPVHVIEIDDVDSEFVRAVIALNSFE
jgi:hypothetical protein